MTTWLNTSFEMRFRVIGGLTVRYAQSEDHCDHALLLSPWPESLLAFMPMWEPLAQYAHLVAIDLPGFGRSQRCDALLSPRAMAEFVLRAADAFELDRPHLLGPGTGTAAALYPGRQSRGAARALSVLRSNALNTGQDAVRAILGTVAGFIVGAALLVGIGTNTTLLWFLLPLAVFLAGVAPAVISFAAGQAAFTLTLVILFNIIQPAGWCLGLVRIEDVASGPAPPRSG